MTTEQAQHVDQGITFKNVWHDNEMYLFHVFSSDGVSTFVNDIFVGYSTFNELIECLDKFKDGFYGGIYDIELGKFGSEYARGALTARLHFQDHDMIYVSIQVQSEFMDFGRKNVANEAKLFFKTNLAFLNDFIHQLKTLKSGTTDEASLQIQEFEPGEQIPSVTA
jgi:hypothetical protein